MEPAALAGLIQNGMSTSQIAAELGCRPPVVAAWLREYGLQTDEVVRRRQNRVEPGTRRTLHCSRHGEAEFVAHRDGSWRCVRCRSEQVSEARRRRKAQLVSEAGGACALCGYDRCLAALQFHLRDPDTKSYGLSHRGTARSLASMRAEAAKCVLLCSNCHAEVEAGLSKIPIT